MYGNVLCPLLAMNLMGVSWLQSNPNLRSLKNLLAYNHCQHIFTVLNNDIITKSLCLLLPKFNEQESIVAGSPRDLSVKREWKRGCNETIGGKSRIRYGEY
jgi:hypothetical protein